jgi:hypothetical protein
MSQFADFEYMGSGSAQLIVRFVRQNEQDSASCRHLRAVAALHARAQQAESAALTDCACVVESAAGRTSTERRKNHFTNLWRLA